MSAFVAAFRISRPGDTLGRHAFRVQPGLPALPVDLPCTAAGSWHRAADMVIVDDLDDDDAETIAWLGDLHEESADDETVWVTAQPHDELAAAVLDDDDDPEWALRRDALAADVAAAIAAMELDARQYVQRFHAEGQAA